jgi:thiamine biosynthesis lipoprotein
MGRHRLIISIGFLICVLIIIVHQYREKEQQLAQAVKPVVEQRYLLGTVVEIKVYPDGENDIEKAIEDAFSEIRNIEHDMSGMIQDNPVDRINENAGIAPQPVPRNLFSVIAESLKYSAMTDGAFDVTVGPLIRLWGFDSKEISIPMQSDIEKLLPLVNYRHVQVSADDSEVFLSRKGMILDLGGAAKGFSVDRAVGILMDQGIKSGIVTAGGDLRAFGQKKRISPLGNLLDSITKPFRKDYGSEPWTIAIRHPRIEDSFLKCILIGEGAVATSGDYQNYIEHDERRYHHLLDPQSGMPAEECISVTVHAPTALEADILATGVFVSGQEKGLKLLESLPDTEGLICYTHEGEMGISCSSGLHVTDCN